MRQTLVDASWQASIADYTFPLLSCCRPLTTEFPRQCEIVCDIFHEQLTLHVVTLGHFIGHDISGSFLHTNLLVWLVIKDSRQTDTMVTNMCTHNIDSSVQSMVNLVVSDNGVAARSDLNSSQRIS